MVAVKPVTVDVPLVALAPLHPFEAVQAVAFVEDHVIVVESPLVTDVGERVVEHRDATLRSNRRGNAGLHER